MIFFKKPFIIALLFIALTVSTLLCAYPTPELFPTVKFGTQDTVLVDSVAVDTTAVDSTVVDSIEVITEIMYPSQDTTIQ